MSNTTNMYMWSDSVGHNFSTWKGYLCQFSKAKLFLHMYRGLLTQMMGTSRLVTLCCDKGVIVPNGLYWWSLPTSIHQMQSKISGHCCCRSCGYKKALVIPSECNLKIYMLQLDTNISLLIFLTEWEQFPIHIRSHSV